MLYFIYFICCPVLTFGLDLPSFLKSIDEADKDLQWIQAANERSTMDSIRTKREVIGQLLSYLQEPEELVAGDAWYNDFRSQECKYGSCPTGKGLQELKRIGKKIKHRKKGRCKHRKNNRGNYKTVEPLQAEKSAKTFDRSPDYDYYNSLNSANSMVEDEIKMSSKSSEPQDQMEKTQNDLSHEANYKLSKFEQETAGFSPLLTNSTFEFRPLNLPNGIDDKFVPNPHIGLNLDWTGLDSQETLQKAHLKRSPNPVDEIKLKTSARLMNRGLGASLPSNALENRRLVSVQDILRDKKHEESPNIYSRESRFGRKLMAVGDSSNQYRSNRHNKDIENGMNIMVDDEFDNMQDVLQKEYGLRDSKFDNLGKTKPFETEKADKLSLSLNEDLFKTPAFFKIERFLKGSGKTNAANATTSITTPKSTKQSIKTSTLSKILKGDIVSSTPPDLSATTPASPSNQQNAKKVNIKLQVNVNATVLPKSPEKLPSSFHKKSILKFPKISGIFEDDDDTFREKRGIIFPALTALTKRRTNHDIKEEVLATSDQYPLDDLISGKLPSQLVKTVYTLVKSNPDLKVIWPGIRNHKPPDAQQLNAFDAIRTEENDSQIKRSEIMLRQVMDSINTIIEQQVRSRTCVPLRPDLKTFYDQILATQAENERENRSKPKREDKQYLEVDIDDEESYERASYEPHIREKYSIVKKLLKEHDQLSMEDQKQVKDIKDSLQMDLIELRKMERLEDHNKRKRRQLREQAVSNASVAVEKNELTPEFLKLLKSVDLMGRNALDSSATDDDVIFFFS